MLKINNKNPLTVDHVSPCTSLALLWLNFHTQNQPTMNLLRYQPRLPCYNVEMEFQLRYWVRDNQRNVVKILPSKRKKKSNVFSRFYLHIKITEHWLGSIALDIGMKHSISSVQTLFPFIVNPISSVLFWSKVVIKSQPDTFGH